MPTFRNFTANVGQSGIPQGSRATATAYGANIGAAMEDLGSTGLKVSQELQDHQIRQDLVQAHKEAAILREKAVRQLDEWRAEGLPVNERMGEWLENELTNYRENRSTHRGRELAEQTSANMASDLLQVSRAYDAKLAGEEAAETAEAMNRSNGVRLQVNPDTLPNVLDENRSFVEALDIPANLKPALIREMNASAAQNAVRGWIELDPKLALEKLQSGKFDDYLTPDNRDVLSSRIRVSIDREEAQVRADRAEAARQNEIYTQTTLNKALLALNADNPEDRLTKGGIDKMALETFADGTPVLPANWLASLYDRAEQVARDGDVVTPRNVHLDLIPRLAGGDVTLEELDELALRGDLSIPDYTRYRSFIEDGTPQLQAVRRNALNNVANYMGMDSQMAAFMPQFGVASTEVMDLIFEREAEYKSAGKNPLDYYREQFRGDVLAIGRAHDLAFGQAATEAAVGALVPNSIIEVGGEQFRYTGGDPYETDAEGNLVNITRVPQEEQIANTPPGRRTSRGSR